MCSGDAPDPAKVPSSAELPPASQTALAAVTPDQAKKASADPADTSAVKKKNVNALRIDLSAPTSSSGLGIPL